MRYVTRDGVAIEVGRVDRRKLDMIQLAEPVPPRRDAETWGGVVESVPVLDDPVYQAQLFDYKMQLWREQLPIIAVGIALPDSQKVKRALKSLSFAIHFTDEKAAFLGYCLDDADRVGIVEEILYQSTVTNRGIEEAVRRFAYEWRDKPLSTWSIPSSHGKRGKLAAEWNAAFRSGLTWAQFCEMSGSEQSAVVAFWALEDKLVYLLTQSK